MIDAAFEGPDPRLFRLEGESLSRATLGLDESIVTRVVVVPVADGPFEATFRVRTDGWETSDIAIPISGEARQPATPGDANHDNALDVSDAVGILLSIFGPGDRGCLEALYADDTGAVDISDAVHLLRCLFQGGRGPVFCALDASPDCLGCAEGSPCSG